MFFFIYLPFPLFADDFEDILTSAKEILSEHIENASLLYFNKDIGGELSVKDESHNYLEAGSECAKTVVLNGSWDYLNSSLCLSESGWNLELPIPSFWNYMFLWWYTSSDIVLWSEVKYTDDIKSWDNSVANVYAHWFCNWSVDDSWNCVIQDIFYDANWWRFGWGLSQEQRPVNKIAIFHTANIMDSWDSLWTYNNNSTQYKQIILTWASSLLVKVNWWTEWSLWDCSDYVVVGDKSGSQVAKLCGWNHLDVSNTKVFRISWDSVQLTFKSDGNNNHWWDVYGCYVIVYGYWDDVNVTENVEIPERENSIFVGREKNDIDERFYAKRMCYDKAIESEDGLKCRSPRISFDAGWWIFDEQIPIPPLNIYERKRFESHSSNIVNGKMVWSYGNRLNLSDVFVFTWADYFKTKIMWWTEWIAYDYVQIMDWNNYEVGRVGGPGLLSENIREYLITWDTVKFNFHTDWNNNNWWNLYGYSAMLYGVKRNDINLPVPSISWWIFEWWFDNPEFLWKEFDFNSYIQSEVKNDITLYAKWSLEDYLVAFQDEDWNVLQSWYFEYWSIPEYVWDIPSKTKTEEYSYIFDGWEPEVGKVNWDIVYSSKFLPVKNKYKISFVSNWSFSWTVSNNEILADYWSEIVFGDDFVMIWWEKIYAVPSFSTAQYSFRFDWWDGDCWNNNILTHNCVITWNFSSVVNKYHIRFFDEDWLTVLNELILPFWETIDYSWPFKLWYRFVWWSGGIHTVSWDMDYTAIYEKDESQKKTISYNIKYFKGNEEFETQVVNESVWCLQEGVDVNTGYINKNKYVGYSLDEERTLIPDKIGSGWTIAVYYNLNYYTVVFEDWFWNVLSSGSYPYWTKSWSLVQPFVEKEGYSFVWWKPNLSNVVSDQKYFGVRVTNKVGDNSFQQNFSSAWWWRMMKTEEIDWEHSAADLEHVMNEKLINNDESINWLIKSELGVSSCSCSLCQNKEIVRIYEWAYENNITTVVSFCDSKPEWKLTRWHLAKMVSNYATNVLWQKLPEKVPSECRWIDNNKERESEEIKEYAVKACSLWLMWLNMKRFQPNLIVTRAQFWTILSRLLYWKANAWWNPYYSRHLNALKKDNIMVQIENPEDRVEFRRWVWLMLKRASLMSW